MQLYKITGIYHRAITVNVSPDFPFASLLLSWPICPRDCNLSVMPWILSTKLCRGSDGVTVGCIIYRLNYLNLESIRFGKHNHVWEMEFWLTFGTFKRINKK